MTQPETEETLFDLVVELESVATARGAQLLAHQSVPASTGHHMGVETCACGMAQKYRINVFRSDTLRARIANMIEEILASLDTVDAQLRELIPLLEELNKEDEDDEA